MYKLIFFVPKPDAERVKKAIFTTGAGSIGNYQNCSFETSGIGQFIPLQGSKATIGEVDKLERVEELKVEILCSYENVSKSVKCLKESHPYEEPAYEVIKLEDF
jgi:hypothetical protein